MHVDRDARHVTPADFKHKQNRSFSAAVRGLAGSRSRRNSDWFFESWQGLLQDEAGDPLALIVNPQPFSIEMCRQCQTCYVQRDYRKLEQNEEKVRICTCGAINWLSHFATFPERMVTPLVLSGTSERGACSRCGAPYRRVVERQFYGDWHPNGSRGHDSRTVNNTAKMATSMVRRTKNGDPVNSIAKRPGAHDREGYMAPRTISWEPTCSHPLFPGEPVPSAVLDPFAGSGTVAIVAERHGRNFIGIELNPEYKLMAEWRIERARHAQVQKAEVSV